MSFLDVTLAAKGYRQGRAHRTANALHRRLVQEPLAVVLWELGGEPFTVGAIGFGTSLDEVRTLAPGEPRSRDLTFEVMLDFARWFNPRFEAPAADRELIREGPPERWRARRAPQVLVPNRATVELLGRIGRRLAYLPTDGPRPADPDLVRLGRHFQYLYRRSGEPGQQLVVAMTDLLRTNWATPLSNFEQASLAALDAYIDPSAGLHGFAAASEAEAFAVGPMPDPLDDTRLEPLMEAFNSGRHGTTTGSLVSRLRAPIEAHYRPLVARTWELMWKCFTRERQWPEAPSVPRRWEQDRDSYTWHVEWLGLGGLQRTIQSTRQAAMTMQRLESTKAQLMAEEACDDPLKMIPYLLDHKAVLGRVTAIDLNNREIVNVRPVYRPLLTLESDDACFVPIGKELWWSNLPHGKPWIVQAVTPGPANGSTVTLKLSTSVWGTLPGIGDDACFSVLSTDRPWPQQLSAVVPWTHLRELPAAAPGPIEESA